MTADARRGPHRVRLSSSFLFLVVVTFATCVRNDGRGGLPGTSQLTNTFVTVDTIYLEEVPGDTIAEIGAVHIAPNGSILVGDRFLPRIRLYSSDGRFIAGQGRFGDAPFEYRRIQDAARLRDGRVIVNDWTLRYTILKATLEPDSTLLIEEGFSGTRGVQAFGDAVVQSGAMHDQRVWHIFRDAAMTPLWRIPAGPDRIFLVPYWSSVTKFLTTAAGDTLIVGNSLLYPIRLYDGDGGLIGEIGSPPPSFRHVPELERGALATLSPGSQSSALVEWLEAFTVIAGLHVVQRRWLVVSHGRISTDPPMPPWDIIEYAVDVYDLSSGAKVLEDVWLPDGARILGGGPYLHVLVAIPPEPWTILQLEIPSELR